MKTIRNVRGEEKILPIAPSVTEQVFVPLIVSPSICQSCSLPHRAASAGWLLLGHLLQRICVNVSCGCRVTVEVQKAAVCCWGFFFSQHLLPDTDCHAITAAMLSLRPITVVKLHKCVDLLLFVWTKGKDAPLLPFALCSRCPAEHQAGAAPDFGLGQPLSLLLCKPGTAACSC